MYSQRLEIDINSDIEPSCINVYLNVLVSTR